MDKNGKVKSDKAVGTPDYISPEVLQSQGKNNNQSNNCKDLFIIKRVFKKRLEYFAMGVERMYFYAVKSNLRSIFKTHLCSGSFARE